MCRLFVTFRVLLNKLLALCTETLIKYNKRQMFHLLQQCIVTFIVGSLVCILENDKFIRICV